MPPLSDGAHLLSVNGMREEGIVEGVRVWRPMLPHEKQDVLAFAHAYGVPYFKDTTQGSTRGKLRNQLQPLLAEMFGAGTTPTSSVLGQDSEQLGEMFESFAMAEFDARLKISDLGAYVDLDGFQRKPMPLLERSGAARVPRPRRRRHGSRASSSTESRCTTGGRARDGWITLKKTNRFFVQGTTLGAFAAGVFLERRRARLVRPEQAKEENDGNRRLRLRRARTTTRRGAGAARLRRVRGARKRRERVGTSDARRRVDKAGSGDSRRRRATARWRTPSPWILLGACLRSTLTVAPAPRKPGGRVYLRPGARLPQFRSVDVAVTGAIPFAVVDVEGCTPDPGVGSRRTPPPPPPRRTA